MLVALTLSLSLSYTADNLVKKETWALALVGSLTAFLILSLVAIHRLPQSPQQLAFKVILFIQVILLLQLLNVSFMIVWIQVPLVPLLPALSIFINAYLMVNMRMVTWVQYSIYMAIGKLKRKSTVFVLDLNSNFSLLSVLSGLSVYIVYGWRNSKEETRMQGKYDVNYDVK